MMHGHTYIKLEILTFRCFSFPHSVSR